MPLSYTEITVGVASRGRSTSQVVGTDVYIPNNGHAGCGIVNTVAGTYSEIALTTSRTRRCSNHVGGAIYTPSNAHASCGKLVTSTGVHTEITLSRSSTRNCSTLSGTTIYAPSAFSTTQMVFAVIDTVAGTATEWFATHPTSATRTPQVAFTLPSGNLFVAGQTGSVGFYAIVNPVTHSYTETLLTHPIECGVIVGNLIFIYQNGSTGSSHGLVVNMTTLATTPFTMPNQTRDGAAVPVGTDMWVSTGNATGGVDQVTPAGVTTRMLNFLVRTRLTAQIVGDKIYLPSNAHASIGVIHDIPLPSLRRGFYCGIPIGGG